MGYSLADALLTDLQIGIEIKEISILQECGTELVKSFVIVIACEFDQNNCSLEFFRFGQVWLRPLFYLLQCFIKGLEFQHIKPPGVKLLIVGGFEAPFSLTLIL